MSIKKNTNCLVCGSSTLTPVIDLGAQYLQGTFVFPGEKAITDEKFPTELVLCDKDKNPDGCGLLQMSHSVDPNILYASYWYRSGINQTMRNHLRGIVNKVVELVDSPHRTVLDIGCNDGTLLKAYPEGTKQYGVDPSDIAKTIEAPITVVSDLFPSEKALSTFAGTKFDVVTSIAMFYDLQDPVGFAKGIESVLAEDGVWVFEMSYLPLMLIQNSFDTICHEHLEYYALAPLEEIMDRANLKLFRHELNDINGGSIRCYACRKNVVKYDSVDGEYGLAALRAKEQELNLASPKTYLEFQDKIETLRSELVALLENINEAGKTVHVYGASTKGNTLLQWYGINDDLVPYAAERNPSKFGAKTLGTNIQILSEEESHAKKPDYYLVLPWHFQNEFLQREKEYLDQSGRFIFPLPEITVIGAEGLLLKHDWV